VGRWWARVFDAQSAFGIDFVWSLGRNQRAVAGDNLLLAFGIHGGSGVNVFSIMYGKLYYPIQSEYCNKNSSEAEDEGSPSEVVFGQWVFNDIFLSDNWNKRYSVVNPLCCVGFGGGVAVLLSPRRLFSGLPRYCSSEYVWEELCVRMLGKDEEEESWSRARSVWGRPRLDFFR